MIPVDGIVIEADQISMDESSVTGESDLLTKLSCERCKSEPKASPFIISGSKVMEGTGKMVITAVGINS